MPTALDALLKSIDPSRNLEQLAARADEALNTFNPGAGAITDWFEFQECLTRFFCHLENTLLRIRPPREVNAWRDWGQCQHIFLTKYGPLGMDTAFGLARTGAEGGLYGILKLIARQVADDYASNEIKARVGAYMNRLSATEYVAATREYLEKFGYLLPDDVTEGSAPRIGFQFFHVLCEHPRLTKRLRHVGR